MMTPLLLIALFGLGAFVAKKTGVLPFGLGKSPTLPKGQRVIVLEDHLSDADRDKAIHAILYEKDPALLDGLAQGFGKAGQRCAEYELRYRAWELRGASGPPPARPTSCASAAPQPSPSPAPAGGHAPEADIGIPGVTPEVAAEACRMLDPSLSGPTCTAVLKALGTETSPQNLEAFAASIASAHPRAAAALQQKAVLLRQGAAPQAPQPAGGGCYGLDANLPPEGCTEVVSALKTSVDKPFIERMAVKYASYPLAQAALLQKLHALGAADGAQAGAQTGAVPNLVAETSPGKSFGAPEPDYAPMEPSIAVAASLSPKLEGTTHHAEGLPSSAALDGHPLTEEGKNGNVTAGLAEAAVAQAAQMQQGGPPPGADPFRRGTLQGRPQRPRGHWFVFVRSHDTPWPMTMVKVATGKKDPLALEDLFAMNPHLWTAPGSNVIAQFKPGDEVNVPGAWAEALIRRGYKLKKD